VLSGKLQQRFQNVQEKFSLITEFARSSIVSIKMIKGFSLEKFQRNRFDQLGRKYVQSSMTVAVMQGFLLPAATLVGNISMLIVLYFGGILVIQHTITLGDFVAFLTYLFMLVWPIIAIGWVVNVAQRGLASLRRVYQLLHEQPMVIPGLACRCSSPRSVAFKFRNLSFTYPSATRSALDNVTLDIAPGIHGITGRTGSGKSTLCHLLVRLYPVANNCLFFNDQDVNSINTDTLRGSIAFVGQEPQLFSASVYENIILGRPNASVSDVRQAAMAAAVDSDIMRFPKQYQSIIGERGVTLSGGQRQRIALARALLSRRPMLIIDDGLSAIDIETAQHVINSIKADFANKTVILISHCINVLRAADTIVMLENGKIISHGRYEDISINTLFKIMLEEQQVHA
jgi:ATP-binding cassette subfamily B protein